MKTITRTAYQYSELSEAAKAKARDWYREGGFDYPWYDAAFEDFQRVAEILGIDIDKKGNEPMIEFSLSYSQSDYAGFYGHWSQRIDSPSKMREYAPKDTELQSIADDLADLIPETEGDYIGASIRLNNMGCLEIEADGVSSNEVRDIMRRLCRWLYNTLRDEYEYLASDEAVAETIEANEYDFWENGERAFE